MTHEQFLAELQRRGIVAPTQYDDPLDRLDPATVRELLPDLLRAHSGRRGARSEHPLVQPILSRDLGLYQLREMSGMTVADFLSATADALSILSVSRFENANSDVAKITKAVDVRDYKTTPLPSLAMPAPYENFEDTETQTLPFKITEAARSGKLRVFDGKVRFSKAVWSCLGEQLTAGIVDYAASIFSLVEMRLVAETLEAGTLDTVSAPVTETGLGTASKALRVATNSAGMLANLAIAALVVPPELESNFRVLLAATQWPALGIIVNPYLTSATTWYAIANPAVSAPILRLRLRGGGVPTVYSSIRESGPETGMAFAVSHSVDFVLSGQPGLVQCTS